MAKRCFLGIEAVLYFGFLYLDLRGGSGLLSSLLKYTGVCLCLGWSLIGRKGEGIRREGGYRRLSWISAGLAGTVCADYFLLFTDKWTAGVICFIGVQLCYGVWLDQRRDRRRGGMLKGSRLLPFNMNFISDMAYRLLSGIAAAAAVTFVLSGAGITVDLLLSVTAVYFTLLLTNTIHGVRLGGRVFAAGMCLFLLCDIQVGIFNAADYLPGWDENGLFYGIASVGMWACYLPAKVLIACAAHDEE